MSSMLMTSPESKGLATLRLSCTPLDCGFSRRITGAWASLTEEKEGCIQCYGIALLCFPEAHSIHNGYRRASNGCRVQWTGRRLNG